MSFNIRGFGSGKDRKIGDFKKLMCREQPWIVALQETKCNTIDEKWVKLISGFDDVGFVQKEKVGKSGGLLLFWDKNDFLAEQVHKDEFYIAVKGKWRGRDEPLIIVNVYGPHDDANKQKLWASLKNFVGQYDVAWVLCGDFNEVREESERQSCVFMEKRAKWFNEFINNAQLIDVPLGGKRFTRICDNGIKFSKLDRFLISEKFNDMWDEVSAIALERKMSDHCPIVLRDRAIDFGPKPIKVFDEWLVVEGAEKIINEAWKAKVSSQRLDCVFRLKLKNVKIALKEWSQRTFGKLDMEIEGLKNEACDWEKMAEDKILTDDERGKWLDIRKKMDRFRKSQDKHGKAKVSG
ncbi:uncharacterized protein [Rutidosis leptorrhynchoides]|uniref:uncharacterized protein n=1 Tax=Rutidosis leptorrhynchoides TaxID=125765 RepID=UPI003A99DF9B